MSACFLRAVALPHGDRPAYLDQLRDLEPALCSEVESLLRHDEEAASILEPGAPLDSWAASLPAPERIGPYHILEKIGEGGMGVVYRAERRDPVRHEVALKVIKPGLETERVLARFESERRVLALMDHPGIARVFDAGVSSQGRPYVAMEYVPGEPITVYCDRLRLQIEARLRLFGQVCEAVHHAHQNAIIHRDIKPSNVLVTIVDTVVIAKVIDFGIAKALSVVPGSGTTLTVVGEFIGTPAYMSPEQAMAQPRNIDTRADIYSLGALLFELLTGCTPFDPELLPAADLATVRRTLSEEDPRAPSLRLRGPDAAAAEATRNRRTDPAGLARQLRGDLDAIVMKALAKDRDRRYGSARELAADIRRHLDDEPIEARPPTASYRLRKLVRRHPTRAAVMATVVPLALGFAVVAGIQAHGVALERDRAEELAEFLTRMYEMPYYQASRHGTRQPKEVLRRSAEKVGRDLGDRPLLQARLQHSIAEALRGIGEVAEAVPMLEASTARLSNLAGVDAPPTLAAAASLAEAYSDQGRYVEAERILRRILDARRRTLGPDALDSLRAARDLGFLYKTIRRHEEAVSLLTEASSGMRRTLGDDDQEALVTASLAASEQLEVGRFDDAEALLLWAIPRMQAASGENSIALYNLACVHAQHGDRDRALRELHESIELGLTLGLFSDNHLQPLFDDPEFIELARTARFLSAGRLQWLANHVAVEAIGGRRYDEAEAIFRFLVSLPCQTAGTLAGLRYRLAELYYREGRYDLARPILETEVDYLRSQVPIDTLVLAGRLGLLFRTRLGGGDTPGAIEALDAAIALFLDDPAWGIQAAVLYLRACRETILGNRHEAGRLLNAAVNAGYADLPLVREDRALAPLHGTPEFNAAMRLLEKRFAPF